MQQEETQELQLETAAEEGQAPAAAAAAAPAAAPQAGAAGPAGAAPGRGAAVMRQISHASEAAAHMQAHAEPEEPPPSSRRRTSMGGIGLSLHKRCVASPCTPLRLVPPRLLFALAASLPAFAHPHRLSCPAAATHPCCAGGPAASLVEVP